MSEFIDELKEIIHCYESFHNPNWPNQKELQVWRKRYCTACRLDDIQTAQFLALPSKYLMENGPEKCIEMIRDNHS